MNMRMQAALATVLMAAGTAFAGQAPCDQDPRARGLKMRIEVITARMDRIEATLDRAEQKQLIELQAKTLREGFQQLRRREPNDACRVELLNALLEQMARQHVVLAELDR